METQDIGKACVLGGKNSNNQAAVLGGKKERVALPKDIAEKMKLYRDGLIPIPQAYIDFHRTLAQVSINRDLIPSGHVIKATYMDSDGWFDGMQLLYVVAKKDSELMLLYWYDGNQGWMKKNLASGGSTIYDSF